MPVGTISWYPNSGTSNHACRDPSALYDATPVFRYHVIKDSVTREILLKGHIRDGLYHFSLQGTSVQSVVAPSTAQVEIQSQIGNSDTFSLWHKHLGNMSTSVVKSVLNKCHINLNKVSLNNVCIALSQGIIHWLTCLHTSEENGVAERKHRHIVDMRITLLAQADLPMEFWAYTFCCVIFDHSPVHSWDIVLNTRDISVFYPMDGVTSGQASIESRPLSTSNSDLSSTTPTVAVPLRLEFSLPTINAHLMVTRSKAGIFKPKAMTVEATELSTIEEAFSTSTYFQFYLGTCSVATKP
ncbi:hypothetical protein PVK06_023658 [Gossypium arboreum]|uniref:GAG-pre-integrase domain-containing protein n=1 Tax=Gossypium arboreum TaxID=29729 RepID=A0ABR0PC79_GOSAR|nr:hypothetical protein PVK06_023658 [Gossypium arboreum]